MPQRKDIINHMLRTLGLSGVSYDQSLHPSVQSCNRTLDTVSSEVQGRGWWFNKEYNLRLVPDNRGEIVVPADALSLTVTGVENMAGNEKPRIIRRKNKLYDAIAHTYELNRSINVDIVLLLDIDDLPSNAQSYIQHKAAETVYLDEDGDANKLIKLQERTALSWQALQAEQLKNLATNSGDRFSSINLNAGWINSSRNPRYIGGRNR